MMVGVNGAGKTTTIGKLAAKFKNKQVSCIAGDTFRAAAVEQLSIWAERNNIRIHKGENGCDAAALCFDGLQEAIKQKDDVVFIDTAGRLQNKTNLIEELQKIQALANYATEDVGIHSEDSSIIVDAKSFMGLFALDFTRPVLIVSEDLNFHRRIANVGETLEFDPHIYQQMVCK